MYRMPLQMSKGSDVMTKQMTTKDKLLNILKRHYELTIKEIMEYFSISEIAVRRHLHELVREDFIKRVSNKQEIGRPYYSYLLTEKGHQTFPNQDDTLSLELLEDLEALYGEQAVTDVLTKWKNREKKLFEQEIKTSDFDEKIEQVAKIRHEHGYMVEVEQTEKGNYQIKYFNCPIATVACAYDQICCIEKNIFEEVFENSEVTPKTMLTKGDHCCTWTINRPN